MFTKGPLTDMESRYKMFRAEVLKSLDLKERRFGFEPEVTARASRYRTVRIYEVGISYYGRTYEEGKKIGWRDGFRALWCLLKYSITEPAVPLRMPATDEPALEKVQPKQPSHIN